MSIGFLHKKGTAILKYDYKFVKDMVIRDRLSIDEALRKLRSLTKGQGDPYELKAREKEFKKKLREDYDIRNAKKAIGKHRS